MKISCTFPSRSPCRPSRVSPYTPSVLICCFCFLCDWSFRLRQRIAYIYCFVASYLFSLLYDWFLWHCPVLHSIFLNDGKSVFLLFIILFKFSRFIFCSCDIVCYGLFGCVEFPFSEVGGTFWLGCFCLLIFYVSGTVLLPCWLYIFWCISIIARSENQPFFLLFLLDQQVFH